MTLAAWKKGEEIDPLIRITVPDKQSAEYNRLIGMMRAAGGDISLLINTLHLPVEQAEVHFGWLFTLHYWAVCSALVLELARASWACLGDPAQATGCWAVRPPGCQSISRLHVRIAAP